MYFEKKGPENTARTVEVALTTARERGIRHIVVASSSGGTALQFANDDGIGVVCVTLAYGFFGDGKGSLDADTAERLRHASVKVLTATHVLSGVERAISSKSGGMYPAEIMSETLRMLGHGVKVCVEVSVMALDAGLIPHGENVIAVGGSGEGADTAVIVTPAHASKIFKTRVHEILCKPR